MRIAIPNLRISTRIVLICFLFTLPTATLLTLAVRTQNASIAFAAAELEGTRMLRPLLVLLDEASNHRLGPDRKGAQSQIDGAFDTMEKMQPTTGVALSFTPEGLKARNRSHLLPSIVKKKWERLSSANSPSDASADAYRNLASDLRGMITHTGDLSNLILDPDLDSYYLMDAALLVIPQLSDRLAVLRDRLETIRLRGELTTEDRQAFIVTAAMLAEADLDRLAADLNTALTEDGHFYGTSPTLATTLTKPGETLDQAGRSLISELRRLADEPSPKVNVDTATSQLLALRRQCREFGMLTLTELDALLGTRLGKFREQRTLQICATAVALLVSILIATAIVWGLNRAVRRAFVIIESVAERLEKALGEVTSLSRTVTSGSKQQAQSLEESSAALQEILAMSDSNAHDAEKARHVGATAMDAAEKGAAGLAALQTAIQEIKESGDRVSNIVRTIQEIAFQTNILSLNAAVEAARAGASGDGFAVVADEVRSLARRSAEAAQETSSNIEDANRKSAEGVRMSRIVGAQFQEIVDQIRSVSSLASGIAASSGEQRVAINTIADGSAQIEELTQTNATHCEGTVVAAESLGNLVAEMRQAIGGLGTLIDRRQSMASRSHSPALSSAEPVHAATFRSASAAFPMPRVSERKREVKPHLPPREEPSQAGAIAREDSGDRWADF